MDPKEVNIPNPIVELETDYKPNQAISIQPNPIHHNIKQGILVNINPKLKNGIVAYLGNVEFKIYECTDFFYALSDSTNGNKKALSSALATAKTCVILIDNKGNQYVGSLDREIYFSSIRTLDVESGKYGGLTFLETRGKKYVGNLIVESIITSDGVLLVPIKSPKDFVPGNAYFKRVPIEETIDPYIYDAQLKAYQTVKREYDG